MTNRRDVMSDAQGSQQLIEEHTSSLVGQIEALVDLLIDAEDVIAEQEKRINSLESALEEAQDDAQLWEDMYQRHDE